MTITKEELEVMKHMTLDEVDRDSLVDLRDVHIDTSLPVPERIASYLEQIKNPYIFKVGKTVVKVSYKENGPTLQECFEEMLRSYFL